MDQSLQDQYNEFPGFDTCVALMRSDDPGTSEEGYWWLEDRAGQYTDPLIEVAQAEQDPHPLFLFVELLGSTKDPAVIPVLASKLSHTNLSVRQAAVVSLEEIGTEQSKALAEEHKIAHPDEY